jgi:hypothetical protein
MASIAASTLLGECDNRALEKAQCAFVIRAEHFARNPSNGVKAWKFQVIVVDARL